MVSTQLEKESSGLISPPLAGDEKTAAQITIVQALGGDNFSAPDFAKVAREVMRLAGVRQGEDPAELVSLPFTDSSGSLVYELHTQMRNPHKYGEAHIYSHPSAIPLDAPHNVDHVRFPILPGGAMKATLESTPFAPPALLKTQPTNLLPESTRMSITPLASGSTQQWDLNGEEMRSIALRMFVGVLSQ